jgi:hypothetical protein
VAGRRSRTMPPLVERGKSRNVALTAVSCRLVRRLYALVRDGRCYSERPSEIAAEKPPEDGGGVGRSFETSCARGAVTTGDTMDRLWRGRAIMNLDAPRARVLNEVLL